MMRDGLYQVTRGGVCAGFVVEGGRVTQQARECGDDLMPTSRCTRVVPNTDGQFCGREANWRVDGELRCGRCVQEIYPQLNPNEPRYLRGS